MWSPRRKPAPARRSPLSCPITRVADRQTGRRLFEAGIAAVILSPTRELALQTSECFAKMAAGTGLRAAVVVGGLSENTQLSAIRKGAQVVIATPGRLYDFLSATSSI